MVEIIPGAVRTLQTAARTGLEFPVLEPWMFGVATIIAVVAAVISALFGIFGHSNRMGLLAMGLALLAFVLLLATAAGRFVTGHW